MKKTKAIPQPGAVNLDELREHAQEAADTLHERLAPVDEWVRSQARERPLVALGVAAAAGYVIGRVLRFF